MYVSHPARRVREDPVEGVTLRVTATDEDRAGAVADRLSGIAT